MKIKSVRFLLTSIRRLFYPRVCVLCCLALVKSERQLCAFCLRKLPKTRILNAAHNPVFDIFRGRIPVRNAGAFLVFRSGGIARQLLHEIKYKDNRDLAVWLGELYAAELLERGIEPVDFIIPVPLHRRKQKQRGYNQSEAFALGIGGKWQIPVCTDVLVRKKFTQTQTRKSKWERWRNVQEVFVVANTEMLTGKKILLVDDVVTTGATLEACTRVLLNAGAEKVDVQTIAYAKE
jgi:ComF family protein